MYSGSWFNTLYNDTKIIQNKDYKKCTFFFREVQLFIVLLLICNSSTNWTTWFTSLEMCVGFYIFDSRPFFKNLNFFCLTKSIDSLKRLNFFQNKNDKKSTNSFASRPLIFKLQLEVWKFNNICVSWISAKTDLETNFSNLENQSLEYVTFSQ